MYTHSTRINRIAGVITALTLAFMPYAAFIPTAVAAGPVSLSGFPDSFGVGADLNDIPNWDENGNDPSASVLAKNPTIGNDSASPDGGRFAKILDDEWMCREVDATGYENLQLSYFWRGDSDSHDNSDDGIVEYKKGSGNCDGNGWTEIKNHDLKQDSSWSTQGPINLKDVLDDGVFRLRFRTDASDQNKDEYFRVDGVNLTGEEITYPDMVAVKTNDVGGTTVVGQTFTWTIRVENIGNAKAVYGKHATILEDHLPFNGLAAYSGPTVVASGVNTSDLECTLQGGHDLKCKVKNGDKDKVEFEPGAYIDVSVSTSAEEVGTYRNPRNINGNKCEVRSDGWKESDEHNNDCEDTVTVLAKPMLTLEKIVDGGEASAKDFTFTVDGEEYHTGDSVELNPGEYTITEDGPENYVASYSKACPNGVVSLQPGDETTCTITNTYEKPEPEIPYYENAGSCSQGTEPVFVGTHTINGNDADGESFPVVNGEEYLFNTSGTFKPSSNTSYTSDAGYTTQDNWSSNLLDYGIHGTDPNLGAHALLGDLGDGVGIVDWGDYSASHSYSFVYTPTTDTAQFVVGDRWGDWFDTPWQNQSGISDNSGSLTLDVYKCEVPARGTLVVKKVVVGGPLNPENFSYTVDGGEPISFEQDGSNEQEVEAGTHTVAEVAVQDYVATYECSAIDVPVDGEAVCTITNTYAPPCGTELVRNGSFEDPVVEHAAKWSIFSLVPGWNFGWMPSVVNAPKDSYLELHRGVNGWTSQEGAQHTELDADWQGPGGPSGEPASVYVSQDIPTKPGQTYTVRFWTSPRPGEGTDENRTRFSWDGTDVETIVEDGSANSGAVWTEHVYSLVAADNLTTIEFADVGTPDSLGGFLDNVSVKEDCSSSVTVCKVDEQQNGLSDWQLSLLGEKVGSVVVYPNGNTYQSVPLPSGDYVFVVNGTYVYRPGSAGDIADGAFSKRVPGDAGYYTGGTLGASDPWANDNDFKSPWTGYLGVLVDGAATHGWGNAYQSDHRYLQSYSGTGSPASFQILDSNYGDNSGSLTVDIYEGYFVTTGQNGCTTIENVPYGTYNLDEVLQDGWEYVQGAGSVTVNDPEENFTVVNRIPEPIDVCTNLEGIQEVIPEGYEADPTGANLCRPVYQAPVCPANTTPVPIQLAQSQLPSSSPIGLDTLPLNNGIQYILEVSGWWTNNGSAKGPHRVDADYISYDSWSTPGQDGDPEWLSPYGYVSADPENLLDVQVGGQFVDWGPYTPSHVYQYGLTGTGVPVNLRVFDGDAGTNTVNPGWYNDNSGFLTVGLTECQPQVPTLSLEKSGEYDGEGTVHWSIDWSVNGQGTAEGLTLTDTLPVGLSYDSATNGASWDPITRTVTWNIGDVLAVNGDTYTISSSINTDLWADEAVSTSQGQRKNGTPVDPSRSDTQKMLGAAQNNDSINFYSLGFGGEAVLRFNNVIQNQEGNDIKVWETTYNAQPCANYPEKVDVYASQDGEDWTLLGSAVCQEDDPEFDLGELDWATYVKLVDVSPKADSHFPGDADGFDIDAVQALHTPDFCSLVNEAALSAGNADEVNDSAEVIINEQLCQQPGDEEGGDEEGDGGDDETLQCSETEHEEGGECVPNNETNASVGAVVLLSSTPTPTPTPSNQPTPTPTPAAVTRGGGASPTATPLTGDSYGNVGGDEEGATTASPSADETENLQVAALGSFLGFIPCSDSSLTWWIVNVIVFLLAAFILTTFRRDDRPRHTRSLVVLGILAVILIAWANSCAAHPIWLPVVGALIAYFSVVFLSPRQ